MRKVLVAALILLMCSITGNASAGDVEQGGYSYDYGYASDGDLTGRYSLGVYASGTLPKDDDMDNSFYIGGKVTYGINEYIAVGGEVGYTSWAVDESGADFGDVQVVPLLADLYLRYPISLDWDVMDYNIDKIVPYGVFGIGPMFWNWKESSLLEDNGISVDMDPELGIKVGGGFDLFLTDNIALNMEGSYIWSDAAATIQAFGEHAEVTGDVDFWTIGGGLKYYF